MATVTDKEAWLAERRKGLGGSDIAKICGLSKWGGPVDVFLDKKGIASPQATTLRMELGTFLEPFVTSKFIEATGKRCIEYTATIHGDGERSCCLGNLDRIVVEDGQDMDEMLARLQNGDLSCVESILECKTTSRIDQWYDDQGNFIVPTYYQTQILWYMGLIPSCKRVYVACVGTGIDCAFDFICIERNDSTVDGIMAYGVKWWRDNMLAEDTEGVMKRLAEEATSVKEVVQIFPKSDPESEYVLTDENLAARFARMEELNAEIKAFENESVTEDGKTREEVIDDIKSELTGAMGANEYLVDADHNVLATFKSGKDTVKDVCDWEAIARALASERADGADKLKELIEAHTQKGVVTRKGARPFKVKEQKKSSAGEAAGKKKRGVPRKAA